MYLIIDLDGTLLRNDFFVELYCVNPREWFRFDILKSKHLLLNDYKPSRTELLSVVNYEVWNMIRAESQREKVKVVSASPDIFVKYVIETLAINVEAFGSIDINLKGENKLKFIKNRGWTPFTYVGDSHVDEIIGKDNSCLKFIRV